MDKLRSLSADLTTYQEAITDIIENDIALKDALAAAGQDASNLKQQAYTSASAIKNSANISKEADTTLNSYSDDIKEAMDLIETKTAEINKYLDSAQASSDAKELATNFQNALINICDIQELIYQLPDEIGQEKINDKKTEISTKLNNILRVLNLIDKVPQLPFLPAYDFTEQEAIIKNALNILESENLSEEGIQEKIEAIEKIKAVISRIDLDALASEDSETLKARFKLIKDEITGAEDFITGDLRTKVDRGLSSLSGMLDNTNALLNSVGETFGNLVVMFNAIGNTVDSANTSLQKTNEAIVYVNGRLIEVINDVEEAGESEKLQVLVNALSGDPEMYGKFFSTPVEVVTEAVYPIENYGSAVAPFYTTLAFWVGALILTAIIKIKPDKTKYQDASAGQLYFGRYVLFWLLGQIQAVIIVIGDIFLLHVQCVHPLLFFLAASLISTTFSLLIYSLVVTWGDVGKAIAVVLVVIQIAGSSGTYPIELLPDFFKRVYIFFPFPYAINAIRECLCGVYKYDYIKYLSSLFIFMAVALVIGLLVRIPFEPINHYMEGRMEDTEMM